MSAIRFQPELDGFPVAVLRVGQSFHPIDANHAWLSLFGSAQVGRGMSWLRAFGAQERHRVLDHLRRVQEVDETAVFEVQGAAAGQWLEVRIAVAHDSVRSADLMVVALDISEQKRREALLSFDVVHDPLTGVHNRVALLEHAQLALARLRRQPSLMALLFLDLDHFKQVNDRYGHSIGDQVLIRAAQRMQLAVRPTDMLARIGGDEFVALCESFGAVEEVQRVADRLVAAFESPIRAEGGVMVRLSASVGVAVVNRPTATVKELLDRADRAMYEAKRQGRGRVHIAAPWGSPPELTPKNGGGVRGRLLSALWAESRIRSSASSLQHVS